MKRRRIPIAITGWLALAFASGTFADGVLAGAVALAIAGLVVAGVTFTVLTREYIHDCRSYQHNHALPSHPVTDRTPAIGDY